MPSSEFRVFSTPYRMLSVRLVRVAAEIVTRVVVPLLVLIAVIAPIASADSFGFQTFAQYFVGVSNSTFACTSTPDDSLTTCTESGFDPINSCTLTGTATSTASIGALELQADLIDCNAGSEFDAQAEFFDTLTVKGYSGSGFIQYDVAGFGPRIDPGGTGGATFLNNGNQPLDFSQTNGAPLASALFPFTSGKATLTLEIIEGQSDCCGEGSPAFDLNASIVGVSLFDSSRKPLFGPAVVSASGVQYPVVTPEPNSLCLSLISLLGLFGLARFMRS